MPRYKSSMSNCLICFDNVNSSKRVKLPHPELGREPVQVFQRICEVLQISFLEIHTDWKFNQNDLLPFCALCCEVFSSVVQLQQQLADIHQRIEDKITSIREKIRNSDPAAHSVGDQRTVNFRVKAGGSRPEESKPPTTTTKTKRNRHRVPEPVVTQQPLDTFASWMIPEPASYQQQTSYHSETVAPVSKTEFRPNTTYSDSYDNNLDDGNNSYSSGVSDNERESQQTDTAPQIIRRVLVSEAFPFLPPHPPRENPFSKLARTQETFSPVITDESGKMTYEGIQILVIPNGYQCGQCLAVIGKDHSSIAMRKAKIHMKGFHLGGYKCSLCEKDFTSADILLQHLNRRHTPKPVMPCTICGKELKYVSLKEHQFTHMNAEEKALARASGFKPSQKKKGSKPCRICGRLTRSEQELKNHELTHIDAKFRKDHKCPYCPKSYSLAAGLKSHIEADHDKFTLNKKLCKDCGQSFPRRHFNQHQKSHTKQECRHCRKLCHRETLEAHEKRCEEKGKKLKASRIECDICHLLFNSVNYLRTHKNQRHKGHWKLSGGLLRGSRYTLEAAKEDEIDNGNEETLQKLFGDHYEVYQYKVIKEDDNGWKCECGKRIQGDENEITVHVKTWHVGDIKCVKCGKRFKNLAECTAHELEAHENKNVYPCKFCGAICGKTTILRHSWTHLSIQEAVAAVNDGQIFPRLGIDDSGRLEILRQMGSPVEIKCVICQQRFDSVNKLASHRLEEHPEAPRNRVRRKSRRLIYPEGNTCHICEKEFSKRDYYLRHLRTHGNTRTGNTMEKPGQQDSRRRRKNKRRVLKIECDEDCSQSNEDVDLKKKKVKREPDENTGPMYEDEVKIKEEVITSEEEDEDSFMQRESPSEREEEVKQPKAMRHQNSKYSRISRRSVKKVNYEEDESDE